MSLDNEEKAEIAEIIAHNRRSGDGEKKPSTTFNLNWAILIVPIIGYVVSLFGVYSSMKDSIAENKRALDVATVKYDAEFKVMQSGLEACKMRSKDVVRAVGAVKDGVDSLRSDVSTNSSVFSSRNIELSRRINGLERRHDEESNSN